MAEYIEREAALKTLCEEGCCEYDPNAPCGCNEWLAISAIPAADVAPVVHGEWINKGGYLVWCSECNKHNRAERTDFCPNCGADMRERKGDDD